MTQVRKTCSEAISVAAAAVDLIIVTLVVAWALEDIVYFSLFVGIPVGIASSVITYLVMRRLLGAGDCGTSP